MKRPDNRFRRDLRSRYIRHSLDMSVRRVQRDIKRFGWLYMYVSARAVENMLAETLNRFLYGEGTGTPVGTVSGPVEEEK